MAKEIYKKVIKKESLCPLHLEILVNLGPVFNSTADIEIVRQFIARIHVQPFSNDENWAKALLVLVPKCIPLDKKLKRSVLGIIFSLDNVTDAHILLLAALLLSGSKSSSEFALSIKKANVRYRKFDDLLKAYAKAQQLLDDMFREDLLQYWISDISKEPFFNNLSLSSTELRMIMMESMKATNRRELLTFRFEVSPEIYFSALSLSKVKVPLDIQRFEQLLIDYPNCDRYILNIFRLSINLDKTELISQLFAQTKTVYTLHSDCVEFHAYRKLLFAALECLSVEDPLYFPYDLLRIIYNWTLDTGQSIFETLRCQILCVHPCLFDPSRLEELSNNLQVQSLYMLSTSSMPFYPADPLVLSFDGFDKNLLLMCVELMLNGMVAPSVDPIFALFSEDVTEVNVVKELLGKILRDTSLFSRHFEIFVQATIPKNRLLYIECLLIFLQQESLIGNSFDTQLILESVQAMLVPYYSMTEYRSQLVSALKYLYIFGDHTFRTDLTSSLIRQVVDESLACHVRCTYLSILTSFPVADSVTIAGIVLSLAKDSRSPEIQQHAIECLADYLIPRAFGHRSILKQASDLLWSIMTTSPTFRIGNLLMSIIEMTGIDILDELNDVSRICKACLAFQIEKHHPSETESLLHCLTRILLLSKTYDEPKILYKVISNGLQLQLYEASLECLKWAIEFLPETIQFAFEMLLRHLWTARLALKDIKLGEASKILFFLISKTSILDSINVIFENTPLDATETLIGIVPNFLDLIHDRGNELHNFVMRCFQRSLELVNFQTISDSHGLTGVKLLECLLYSLNGVTDPNDTTQLVLSMYQPHILSVFGSACNCEKLLVNAVGYDLLFRMISVHFYGLGILHHPRIERLVHNFAVTKDFRHDSPLVIDFYRAEMTAASSYIGIRELFDMTSFDANQLSSISYGVVESGYKQLLDEGQLAYRVQGHTVYFDATLVTRCAISLVTFNGSMNSNRKMIALALSETKQDNIELLCLLDSSLVPEDDLVRFFGSVDSPNIQLLRLVEKHSIKTHHIINSIPIEPPISNHELTIKLLKLLWCDEETKCIFIFWIHIVLRLGTVEMIRILKDLILSDATVYQEILTVTLQYRHSTTMILYFLLDLNVTISSYQSCYQFSQRIFVLQTVY